jgi:hypothetical protein
VKESENGRPVQFFEKKRQISGVHLAGAFIMKTATLLGVITLTESMV